MAAQLMELVTTNKKVEVNTVTISFCKILTSRQKRFDISRGQKSRAYTIPQFSQEVSLFGRPKQQFPITIGYVLKINFTSRITKLIRHPTAF